MSLDSLPNEVIACLPRFIDNIETFTNAVSSCRLLRDNFSKTHPKTILRLAAASAPTFFSPHPHFLTAATARQACDWALGDEERTGLLRQAFRGGIESLFEFCRERCGLTLDDIRRMHLSRFSIINPLADNIDKMAGAQWYQTPNFWDTVSSAYTIDAEVDRAAFQIIIYGELFARSMDAFLEPQKNLPYFDIETRLDYLAYCVPDWGCRSYPGFTVHSTGPYAPVVKDRERVRGVDVTHEGDQVAMRHIVTCKRWRGMWADAIRAALSDGEEFTDEDEEEEHWRRKLYRRALQTQGLDGLQLVTLPPGKVSAERWERTRSIKRRIDALQEPPAMRRMARNDRLVFQAPDMPKEIQVVIRSYSGWGYDSE